MLGAMNVEVPLVGDGDLDEKIKEWLQWDKVIAHSFIHSLFTFRYSTWDLEIQNWSKMTYKCCDKTT
jgi:hypothetical protein